MTFNYLKPIQWGRQPHLSILITAFYFWVYELRIHGSLHVDWVSKNEQVESAKLEKMKFLTMGFFSKCDQIRKKLRKKLRIWSHLLKKSLMENFILCNDPGLMYLPN